MSKIHDLQTEFLTALSLMETRVEDQGKIVRKIDVDEKYMIEVINAAKKPLGELLMIRHKALERVMHGFKGHKRTALIQAIMDRSKNDQLYWIDNWCYIFNPWLTKWNHLVEGGFPAKLPFILFEKQRKYIKWKEDLYKRNKSGLVYKCREVGASWLNVANQTWHWFFEERFQGRFGSLKVTEVDDKNNPDSIFAKIRFIIYNTPRFMRPKAYWEQDNKYDNILKIFNPDNNALIAGEGGDNMGRGGRSSIFDCDEWANVEHDKMVDAALSNNCPCRFYTSTPKGMDNDFAAKYHSGKLPIFSFDYWDDPRKSKDWFDNFSEHNDEAVVAQEVLKKFDAFVGGTAIPTEWVNAACTLYEWIENGKIEYSSDQKSGGLDVAAGGRNRSVLLCREGIVVKEIEEWNIGNTTTLTELAGSRAEIFGVDILGFDPIAVGVGVRSTFEERSYNFMAIPVDYRGAASDVPLPGDTRPAHERCANRRAEIVCRVKKRFENAYERVAKGIEHPIESCVAIPRHQKLVSQLSLPVLLHQGGKWRLESKEQMVHRGVESPDFFDVLMISFAEERVEKRVIQHFEKKICTNDETPWDMFGDHKHYVSIFHEKGFTAGAIGAVWWPQWKRLQIYDEISASNPTVSMMTGMILSKFKSNVDAYVGNKEIFGKKPEEDSLFMDYLNHNILIYENWQHNELSAIEKLEEMFARGGIQINRRCKNLIAQLATWDRKRGVPQKEGNTLALSLTHLVNYLEEQGVFNAEPELAVMKSYRRREEDKKQRKEDNFAWMR